MCWQTFICYFEAKVFNFFSEIVADFGLEIDKLNSFNIVNMSNKLVYIEGQKGVVKISSESMSIRVKGGVVVVFGQNLKLKKITGTTVCIVGKIEGIECK